MRLLDLGAMAIWTRRTRNSLRRLHQRGILKPVACDVRYRRLLYRMDDYKHLVLPATEAEMRHEPEFDDIAA